jgi:hypothetical protein
VSAFLPKKTLDRSPLHDSEALRSRHGVAALRNAMYKDLADYDKNAFMPGVDDLPQDLIMLVQVNQYFIDAVMDGANVEMNRELLWRGFPTDLRGTPFQRFWDRIDVTTWPASCSSTTWSRCTSGASSRSASGPTRT